MRRAGLGTSAVFLPAFFVVSLLLVVVVAFAAAWLDDAAAAGTDADDEFFGLLVVADDDVDEPLAVDFDVFLSILINWLDVDDDSIFCQRTTKKWTKI